jgi:hypothetical protein
MLGGRRCEFHCKRRAADVGITKVNTIAKFHWVSRWRLVAKDLFLSVEAALLPTQPLFAQSCWRAIDRCSQGAKRVEF